MTSAFDLMTTNLTSQYGDNDAMASYMQIHDGEMGSSLMGTFQFSFKRQRTTRNMDYGRTFKKILELSRPLPEMFVYAIAFNVVIVVPCTM